MASSTPQDINKITLENILASVPVGLYWKNASGTYIGANEHFVDMLGLGSTDYVMGCTDSELPWCAQAETFSTLDQKVLTTGEKLSTEDHFVDVHGKAMVMLTHRAPIFDESGDVIGIIASITDITTQKIAEEKNEESQVYLENVVSNLPGNIYWKDINGVIRGCNNNLAITAGFNSAEELIGKKDDDPSIPWSSQGREVMQNDRKVMATGENIAYEEVGIMPDGSHCTFFSTKAPLRNHENQVIGVLGISIDITERKRAELALAKAKKEAELANQSKSYFMASLGHEFRTPLNHVIGLTDILKRSWNEMTKDEQQENLNYVHQAGENLLSLINDIILFSKMDAGHFNVDLKPVNLRSEIVSALSTAQHRIEDKPVSFVMSYPEMLSEWVEGDAQRIRQVLTNLLENAIKFTNQGSISVSVEAELSELDESPLLRVEVKDSGIGIPQEKQKNLFKKFSQVHSEYSDQRMGRYQGVGLGLAIVKELVTLMGGEVGVKSSPGRGSTFFFTLPIAKLDEVSTNIEEAEKERLERKAQEVGKNIRVLLVEDDRIAQKITCDILERYGCKIDVVDSGKQALSRLNDNQYAFALMDIGLPDLNGVEVAKRYRSTKRDAYIPIIGLSAQGLQDGEKTVGNEFDDYIAKPVVSEQIVATIINWGGKSAKQ